MIFVDNHRVYDIDLRDTPTFPASLEERAEAQGMQTDRADTVFLKWWEGQCRIRGVPRRVAAGEDILTARRLLARRTVPQLQELAVVFFNQFADPLREKNYPHHMRLFAHHLRDCEDVLSHKAIAKTDEERGTTFG